MVRRGDVWEQVSGGQMAWGQCFTLVSVGKWAFFRPGGVTHARVGRHLHVVGRGWSLHTSRCAVPGH